MKTKNKKNKYYFILKIFFIILMFISFSNETDASVIGFHSPSPGQNLQKGSTYSLSFSHQKESGPFAVYLKANLKSAGGEITKIVEDFRISSSSSIITKSFIVPDNIKDGKNYKIEIVEYKEGFDPALGAKYYSPTFDIVTIEFYRPRPEEKVQRWKHATISGKILDERYKNKEIAFFLTNNPLPEYGGHTGNEVMWGITTPDSLGNFNHTYPAQWPSTTGYKIKACFLPEKTMCSYSESFTISDDLPPIEINYFKTNQDTIYKGQGINLTWSTVNAHSCRMTMQKYFQGADIPFREDLPLTGSLDTGPLETDVSIRLMCKQIKSENHYTELGHFVIIRVIDPKALDLKSINNTGLAVQTIEAVSISDTQATLKGKGLVAKYQKGCEVMGQGHSIMTNKPCIPENQSIPDQPVIGYFRYSRMSIPPIFCNQIYGSKMRSTDDIKLEGLGTFDFSKEITGLLPDTTYYYCAILSNRNNISYGEDQIVKQFRTLPCQTCKKTEITTEGALTNKVSTTIKGVLKSTEDARTYFEYREKAPNLILDRRLNVLDEDSSPQPISDRINAILDNDNDDVSLTDLIFGNNNEWKKTPEVSHLIRTTKTEDVYKQKNISSRLTNLKPSTNYEYRAVAVSNLGTFRGNIKTFRTEESTQVTNPCIRNPRAPECVNIQSGADLIAGNVTPRIVIGGEKRTFKAIIANLGNIYATEPSSNPNIDAYIDELTHFFQINKNSVAETTDTTIVREVKTTGIGAESSVEVTTEETLAPGATMNIRVCASGLGGNDIRIENNCGNWVPVRGVCPASQYYDSKTNSCLGPASCSEKEIFDWSTKTCIPKTECNENTHKYNPWSNSCIPLSLNCNSESESNNPICQPGPGWGGGYGGGGYGGGVWSGGGWIDDEWHGDTWTGNNSNNNIWCGGVWKNGRWISGGWCGEYLNTSTPPNDAIVREGEGVEHVFVRQILKNNILQQKYGYNTKTSIDNFSWDIAHLIAKTLGYVGKDRKEIRVSRPNIAAYELRIVGTDLMVYEYYDNKLIKKQKVVPNLKEKSDYEYYFNK